MNGKPELGSDSTVVDWDRLIRGALCEMFGYDWDLPAKDDKIVQVDERKFGQRMLGSQWAFGGIECESGKRFVLTARDRKVKALVLTNKCVRPSEYNRSLRLLGGRSLMLTQKFKK